MAKNNYHDYYIKDGQYIGKLNEMYEACEDPWMQSMQPNKYARMAGLIHLKNFGIQSVLECGCGLGYYADWIYREMNFVPKSLDIAPVAIERARQLFPHLDFEVADVISDLKKFTGYDCVLFSEIMWFILPQLPSIFEDLRNFFKDKYLLVNQVFYKGTQRYGVEYFTNLIELKSFIPFTCVAHCEATILNDITIESSSMYRI